MITHIHITLTQSLTLSNTQLTFHTTPTYTIYQGCPHTPLHPCNNNHTLTHDTQSHPHLHTQTNTHTHTNACTTRPPTLLHHTLPRPRSLTHTHPHSHTHTHSHTHKHTYISDHQLYLSTKPNPLVIMLPFSIT